MVKCKYFLIMLIILASLMPITSCGGKDICLSERQVSDIGMLLLDMRFDIGMAINYGNFTYPQHHYLLVELDKWNVGLLTIK